MKSHIKEPLIVYLDQFAVSEMIEAKNDETWSKIKSHLIEYVNNGQVICPLSSEHLFETAPKDFKQAAEHDDFLYSLSKGLSFKPEILVVTQLISSRIRKNNLTLNTFFHTNATNRFNDKRIYKQMNEHNNKSKELLGWTVEGINQIRQLTGQSKINAKLKNTMYNALKAITVNKMIERINDLFKQGRIILKGFTYQEQEVVNWPDSILFRLMEVHKFSKKEMMLFRNDLKNNGFNNIPTLDIRFSLEAIKALYNKKETPGDQIDISRLATGLPKSDFLFTDKRRKSEILELGLNKKYNTAIYSGTAVDQISFLQDLKSKLGS
ncbi:hypothetical protein [Leeuwenhoekiella sp. H156]|uniref:hypothetical protein n=1 Tax=Leeuwenhoekiella sp. H156 TaxID=3450128 RepID=UPI003FA4AE50